MGDCNCAQRHYDDGVHNPGCAIFYGELEDMSIKLFKNLPPPVPQPPPTYSLEGMSYEQKQQLSTRLSKVVADVQSEINALRAYETLALDRLNAERQFFSRVVAVLRGQAEERQREIGKK